MVDIKKLTVDNDDQRLGWIELLKKAGQYHYDKPEIIGEDDDVFRVHSAWSRGILDAVSLIEMWEVVEDDDIKVIDG